MVASGPRFDMLETLRKSVEMLSPKMRRRWLLLVPLAVIAGIAEMGAAAGIFALVAFLTNGPSSHGGWFAAFTRRLPWQGENAILQLTALLHVRRASTAQPGVPRTRSARGDLTFQTE